MVADGLSLEALFAEPTCGWCLIIKHIGTQWGNMSERGRGQPQLFSSFAQRCLLKRLVVVDAALSCEWMLNNIPQCIKNTRGAGRTGRVGQVDGGRDNTES